MTRHAKTRWLALASGLAVACAYGCGGNGTGSKAAGGSGGMAEGGAGAPGTGGSATTGGTGGVGTGGGGTSAGGTSAGGTSAGGGSGAGLVQMGSPQDIWNTDVSHAAVSANSATYIDWLQGRGWWGPGAYTSNCTPGQRTYGCNYLYLSTDFYIMHTNSSEPMSPMTKNSKYYLPDCDNLTHFPLPAGGIIEGSTNNGYSCASSSNDCHLFVYDDSTNMLYESYHSNVVNGALTSQCAVMWNMSPTFTYGPTLRDNPTSNTGSGDQCTSADAAGLPMSAFLFSPDAIVRGHIDHALRLTLPNQQIQQAVYVRPAVHLGGPSGPASAPPYGTRFRLKASFDYSGFSPGGQVIAKALQKYGMVIADGGDNCISAVADTFSTAKWTDADVNLTAVNKDIGSLQPSDFEVIDTGPSIKYNGNCRRTPLSN